MVRGLVYVVRGVNHVVGGVNHVVGGVDYLYADLRKVVTQKKTDLFQDRFCDLCSLNANIIATYVYLAESSSAFTGSSVVI